MSNILKFPFKKPSEQILENPSYLKFLKSLEDQMIAKKEKKKKPILKIIKGEKNG